jgi:serine/threonine-protein kinase
MAEVYVGQRLGPSGFQKRVAIKFLMPSLATDPQFLEMFLDEARLVAMFHHPNLVQIFDVGEIDGRLCMVMEYVDGGSLAQLVRQATTLAAARMPPVVAVALLAQACDGLESAHAFKNPATGESLGFVHRDISPHNLLLTRDGLVKVADFGIAKSTSNLHVTSANEFKGKLSYMAPEQINRNDIDKRADVWALGVVLYELLAGKRLFSGGNEAQLIRAVIEAPLEASILEVPEELRPIVKATLERDPDRRIATAGELGHQLRGWLDVNNGSLDNAVVARWIEPYLPPHQADDFTPSKAALAEVAVGQSAPPPEVSRTTERLPSDRRRWVVAAFALVAAVTFFLLFRSFRSERPPAQPVAQLAPPVAQPVAEPAAPIVLPVAAPAPVAPPRSPTVPAPVAAKTARLVHPAPVKHGAKKAAASSPDDEGDDDDVGLVNPFHGK